MATLTIYFRTKNLLYLHFSSIVFSITSDFVTSVSVWGDRELAGIANLALTVYFLRGGVSAFFSAKHTATDSERRKGMGFRVYFGCGDFGELSVSVTVSTLLIIGKITIFCGFVILFRGGRDVVIFLSIFSSSLGITFFNFLRSDNIKSKRFFF